MIRIARVYEPPGAEDGTRVLVDRLWPRGVRKQTLKLDRWLKEVAPSDDLRRWFSHDRRKWEEFRRRYFAELDGKPDVWKPLLAIARKGRLTLLYGAKDTRYNNAVALKEYLQAKLKRRR